MRKLLNTIYITSPDAYLALDGENVVVKQEQQVLGRIPLHNVEGIVSMGHTGVSPALMGSCAKRNIALSFLTSNGRFLARIVGESHGNVVLRKTQYRISDDPVQSLRMAKCFLTGKIYNGRRVVERAIRDYPYRLDIGRLKSASDGMAQALHRVEACLSLEELRGVEGEAATRYFGVFDEMILQQKKDFSFRSRNRRPPLDRINAMLSFVYTLLMHDSQAALETAGLDSYVGFLHRDRPGRPSLALDLLEEFRSVLADRFVLSLINLKKVSPTGFYYKENGAVYMDADTREIILKAWQTKKRETLTHPFLGEKIPWGLAVHMQALLLARTLRGDLDRYPPFLLK